MRLRRQVVPIDESVEEKLYRSDMLPPVEEMTQHELDAFSVLCRLNSCCSSLLGDGLPQRTPLKQAVEDVNQCLDVLLQKFKEERNRFNGQLPRYSQSVNIPTGIYLNGVFSLLEMCKCISTFLEIVDANTKRAENSLPKEQVARLRDSVEKFYRFIRTDVTDIKDGLSTANDELHQVMRGSGEGKDGDVWKAMDGLMDKSWIEKTGVELIESWLDAVDGVLKIRLGLR